MGGGSSLYVTQIINKKFYVPSTSSTSSSSWDSRSILISFSIPSSCYNKFIESLSTNFNNLELMKLHNKNMYQIP